MPDFREIAGFAFRSAVAGLALAFIAVLIRPELVREPLPQVGPTSFAEAVDASSPAVANVFTERTTGRGALGSAVVLDSAGFLVTNWHVVRDATQIRVQLADGRVAVPEVVGADPDTEIALLKVDLPNLPAIRTSSSDELQVGEVVLAIGNSLGLSQTVTMGIVSATGRGQLGVATFEDFIQTDAAINIGNSGGALINTAGELVGINTAVVSRGARGQAPPEGIGFAIPINLVRGVMAQLIEFGRVIRGYLGIIEMSEISFSAGQHLGLDGGAVQIMRVDGPARTAGLTRGDILTHFDETRITGAAQLINLVARTAPGQRVELRGLQADGTPLAAVAVLTERDGLPGS